MRCTAFILCHYSTVHHRTVNIANFTAESIQEAVQKATKIVKGYDRKVLMLLVNGKNEFLSVGKEFRVSTMEFLARAS